MPSELMPAFSKENMGMVDSSFYVGETKRCHDV